MVARYSSGVTLVGFGYVEYVGYFVPGGFAGGAGLGGGGVRRGFIDARTAFLSAELTIGKLMLSSLAVCVAREFSWEICRFLKNLIFSWFGTMLVLVGGGWFRSG